jgi:structural maintenance of chromosomes protein 6
MSEGKRRYDEEEQDEEEQDDIERHGSESGGSSTKRAKIDSPASDPRTDEEQDEDSDNDDDLYDSDDSDSEGAVTHTPREKSESGIILSIEARNFMCHRHLKITFGRNINFINGSNGSGKSAILAALQVCLGARARHTHRATKVSDLIRHGWSGDAEVEVKLLNAADGYNHQKYGGSITVKRIISKTSTAVHLLADSGEIISRDRKEVSNVMYMSYCTSTCMHAFMHY